MRTTPPVADGKKQQQQQQQQQQKKKKKKDKGEAVKITVADDKAHSASDKTSTSSKNQNQNQASGVKRSSSISEARARSNSNTNGAGRRSRGGSGRRARSPQPQSQANMSAEERRRRSQTWNQRPAAAIDLGALQFSAEEVEQLLAGLGMDNRLERSRYAHHLVRDSPGQAISHVEFAKEVLRQLKDEEAGVARVDIHERERSARWGGAARGVGIEAVPRVRAPSDLRGAAALDGEVLRDRLPVQVDDLGV